VLFYAAVFGCGNALDYKCTPNEIFQMECNTCKCSSDGQSASCTDKLCVDSSTVLSKVLSVTTEAAALGENLTTTVETILEHIENNNHVCTPNDVKMQDCNRCRCAANGIGWFCTRRLCPGNGSNGHLKRAVKSSESPECVPGEKWNDGCNDCFCTVNGLPACTLMLCSPMNYKNHHKRSLPIEKNCTPGTTWQQDCNTCFCGDTGFAACTLKGCLDNNFHQIRVHNTSTTLKKVSVSEYNDPNFSCEPLGTFKLDCNTCKCSADGKGATWCTKKRCVPDE